VLRRAARRARNEKTTTDAFVEALNPLTSDAMMLVVLATSVPLGEDPSDRQARAAAAILRDDAYSEQVAWALAHLRAWLSHIIHPELGATDSGAALSELRDERDRVSTDFAAAYSLAILAAGVDRIAGASENERAAGVEILNAADPPVVAWRLAQLIDIRLTVVSKQLGWEDPLREASEWLDAAVTAAPKFTG
jgi:hypothetical protein